MIHYWGTSALAERLDCSQSEVFRLIRECGLPVRYRIRAPGHPLRATATEAMILAWELSYSASQRARRMAKRKARIAQNVG